MRAIRAGAISCNYFNMPLWIARDLGFFEHAGLAVTLELYEPIDAVTERLRDGRLDLALGVTEHVILDREAGGRLCIVGGNVNRLPFSLIARPGIRQMSDLRGARIGVSSIAAGSSSLLMQMLAAHGLRHERDYRLVAVGPILTRWEKLQTGEIDAGLQGAPLNHIAIDAGYSDLGSPRDQFPDFQFTSLNVDAQWAARHEEVVVAFLSAFIRAHEWFYDHPTESIAIAMRETGITRAYAERAWADYIADQIFPRDGKANPRAVQTLIEVSALIRALPRRSRARPEDYIESRYCDAASRDHASARPTSPDRDNP